MSIFSQHQEGLCAAAWRAAERIGADGIIVFEEGWARSLVRCRATGPKCRSLCSASR